TGASIQANLGRFGPYVVHNAKDGKDYRSLKAGDDVLTVTFERAMELLSEPKKGRGSRSKTKKPLRELGSHPDTEEPVNIYEGPYGNYIKHGKTNVGIPEGETVESITLEKALELLASKAPKGKSTRKTTKSKTSSTKKSSSTKSSSTKSSSAKSKKKTEKVD
ncbi:MAG: topoisomerase C-terminal repeat-containing protein, partial [Cyanobacteria bacterium J06636_27]